MKRLIWISCGALLLGAFASCEPYLSRDEALAEKPCDPRGNCAAGYYCDRNRGLEGVCVSNTVTAAPNLPANAGVGGSAGAGDGPPEAVGAGAGGEASIAGAGSAEPGGAGGMPGSAGAGSLELGGSGGSDTGEPAPVADAGCIPVPLFPDLDGDGVGSVASGAVIQDCPPVGGFATEGDDCNDAEPDVFPGQIEFFVAGYEAAPGIISFDYDCSGSEEPGPDVRFVAALTDCPQRMPLCGADIGYRVPANPREGDGVNPLCGTNDRVRCSIETETTCGFVTFAGERPIFTCH